MSKQLKIGFDLDGVILYNPVRIFRKIITDFLKPLRKKIIHKSVNQKEIFYIPKTTIIKFIWILLHKTSFMINPGYKDLKRLAKNKKIKLYLITGRYSFLKKDLYRWLKRINSKKVFNEVFFNKKDNQPHFFKKKMIEKLKLDYYVEDNWDIVNYLNNKKNKTKILWLTNILDKNIPYQFKFFSLKEVFRFLKTLV